MSDLYTEVLVKKQQTGKDKAIKGVLIFFTVLFAAAGIMMNPLILLLALVLGIVDYIFIPKLSVEFEYLYVNGELDIDRIYSQSRRKRAASYELSNMEILAPYQSHQLDSYKNNQSIKRYNYSSGIEGHHTENLLILATLYCLDNMVRRFGDGAQMLARLAYRLMVKRVDKDLLLIIYII